MTSKDILDLKARIAKRARERDTEKDDEALYRLSEMPGWAVLKDRAERMIVELLVPGIGQDSADLATIGAVTRAREFALEAIQSIIGIVESTRAAKEIQNTQKNNDENGGE